MRFKLVYSELREMLKQKNVHIGSHNHSHVVLNEHWTRQDLIDEIQVSKKWIESNLGQKVRTYCYPNGLFGNFTAQSKDVCRESGYEAVFTLMGRYIDSGTDQYEIPRFGLNNTLSIRKIIYGLFYRNY